MSRDLQRERALLAADLQRPDGVLIPLPAAQKVLRLLFRSIRDHEANAGGLVHTRELLVILEALTQGARRCGAQGSPVAFDGESAARVPGTVLLSITDVAGRLGCSPQWARHLAAGPLKGHRHASTWVVEEQAVRDYERGRAR